MRKAYGKTYMIYNEKCFLIITKVNPIHTVKTRIFYAAEYLNLTKIGGKANIRILRKILGARSTKEGWPKRIKEVIYKN